MDDEEREGVITRGLERRAQEWAEAQTDQGRTEADQNFKALLVLTCENNADKKKYEDLYENRKKQYAEED